MQDVKAARGSISPGTGESEDPEGKRLTVCDSGNAGDPGKSGLTGTETGEPMGALGGRILELHISPHWPDAWQM